MFSYVNWLMDQVVRRQAVKTGMRLWQIRAAAERLAEKEAEPTDAELRAFAKMDDGRIFSVGR